MREALSLFLSLHITRCPQIEDLERRTRAQKEQIFDLKEQLTNNQADLKLRQAQLDEKLTLERQKFKDDLQEIEAQKQREVRI